MVERVTNTSVNEAPATRARLQAGDYASGDELVGRAVSSFGQQLQQTSQDVDEIMYKYDAAAAKKADAEDALALSQLQTQALSSTGIEAQDAVKVAREAAEDLRKGRMTDLKGRRRDMYANSFNERVNMFTERLTGHAIKQADLAERGAASARSVISLDLAAGSWTDPDGAYLKHKHTAFEDFKIANRGMAPDQLKYEWTRSLTEMHSNIVSQITSRDPDDPNNDAADAMDWIDTHAAEILPSEEPKLRNMVRPLMEAQQGYEDFGGFLSFLAGDTTAVPPDDGEVDPLAPTPPMPRQAGQPIEKIESHVLGGKGNVSNTAAQHVARGSDNALDIAAPAGTSIYPPMSGRVIRNWNDTEHGGGWSLLVQHPNGMVTGYAHMRSQSPISEGDEVDSTTAIGAVGSTGKSTGNHLHFTVRDTKGAKIDPQSVDWAAVSSGPGPAPRDPEGVSWKEPDLPAYSADQTDLGFMLAKAHEYAKARGFSPRRYEELISRVRQQHGINENLKTEREDDLREAAAEAMVNLDYGMGLTDPRTQIPNFGLLPPEDKMRYMEIVREGRNVAPNGDKFLDLFEMAIDPNYQQRFIETVDPRTVPGITPSERKQLLNMRQQIIDGDGSTKATKPSAIWTEINRWYEPKGGKEEQKRLKKQLYDRVASIVDQRGGEIDPVEIERIVRQQTVEVTVRSPGKVWGTNEKKKPLFIVQDEGIGAKDEVTVVMPQDVRDDIIDVFTEVHGRAPTGTEIQVEFLRLQGR